MDEQHQLQLAKILDFAINRSNVWRLRAKQLTEAIPEIPNDLDTDPYIVARCAAHNYQQVSDEINEIANALEDVLISHMKKEKGPYVTLAQLLLHNRKTEKN